MVQLPSNSWTSAQITINYNNNTNSTYQMFRLLVLGVYGTAGIY
jgi:hypothetical protein